MKNSSVVTLFLFACFFQKIFGIAADGMITNPIIEQVKVFMLDNEHNRSLVVRRMLKNYIKTHNERFLQLVMTMINKDDPLHLFLKNYFEAKELAVISED